jgi:hypothetical protein
VQNRAESASTGNQPKTSKSLKIVQILPGLRRALSPAKRRKTAVKCYRAVPKCNTPPVTSSTGNVVQPAANDTKQPEAITNYPVVLPVQGGVQSSCLCNAAPLQSQPRPSSLAQVPLPLCCCCLLSSGQPTSKSYACELS